MKVSITSRLAMTGIGVAAAAMVLPSAAQAQVDAPLSHSEVLALPSDLQSAPAFEEVTETVTNVDGIETVTRTRRIDSAPHGVAAAPHSGQWTSHNAGFAPGATVFQREQWIEECERRTDGRDNDEAGGIIGGLLGAIAGGIIGNRVADGDRLAGTLIGGGLGGIGGVLLGNLIGGGRDRDGNYDCEAALDSYLSQHGSHATYPGAYPTHRVAARTIPAPTYAVPVQYSYAPAYHQQYSYAPPQQIVYVPVRYEQQQRVIVRETVREEVIPGAVRTIPAPEPVPAPRLRYIKGN